MYLSATFCVWLGEFAIQALDKLPVPLASAFGIYYSATLAFKNHDRSEWRKRRRDQLDQNCEKALSIIHHVFDSSQSLVMAINHHYQDNIAPNAKDAAEGYIPFKNLALLIKYAEVYSYFDASSNFFRHADELNAIYDRLRLMRSAKAAEAVLKYKNLSTEYFKQKDGLSHSKAKELSDKLKDEGDELIAVLADCLVPDEE